MKFYVESCTVYGEDNLSYDVISDGCGDSDVAATLHSDSKGEDSYFSNVTLTPRLAVGLSEDHST